MYTSIYYIRVCLGCCVCLCVCVRVCVCVCVCVCIFATPLPPHAFRHKPIYIEVCTHLLNPFQTAGRPPHPRMRFRSAQQKEGASAFFEAPTDQMQKNGAGSRKQRKMCSRRLGWWSMGRGRGGARGRCSRGKGFGDGK